MIKMKAYTKEELKKSMLLYAVTDRYWLKEGETLLEKAEEALEGGATFLQLREKDADKGLVRAEAEALQKICRERHIPFVIDDDIMLAAELGLDGVHVGQKDLLRLMQMETDDFRKAEKSDSMPGKEDTEKNVRPGMISESGRISERDALKAENGKTAENVGIEVDVEQENVRHLEAGDLAVRRVREIIGEDKILGVSAETVEEAVLAEKAGADYLGVGAVFPTGSKDDAIPVSHETLRQICEAVSIPVVAIGGITLENMHELGGTGIDGIAVISAIFGKPDIKEAAENLAEEAGNCFRQ